MITQQKKLVLSQHTGLYDILVPADHFLRRLHDDIDFSFIYRELVDKYSESMGRTAYDPVMMFKYLILKVISKLSDVDLVNEVRVNMAYKFFLDMAPEEMPVDDSTLCKFRRTRLRDTNLTDLLLAKTFEMAEGKGILRRSDDNRIHIRAIIDGTHTVSAVEGLLGEAAEFPRVKRVLNRFRELVDDITDHYSYSPVDPDARVGHKSADTEFFGYKTQIVMDAETDMVVGVRVTSGEVGDALPGREALAEVLAKGDFKVDEVLGDAAYSGQPILELAREHSFELLAPPHPNLGSGIDGRDGFTFNKDADMFICPNGHLAVSKRSVTYKNDNGRKATFYTFDRAKCSVCPQREKCLKGAKTKTFSVTQLTPEQRRLLEHSQTQDFRDRRRERYKIEAKNAHVKRGLGYGRAMFYGLDMMTVQCAVTMFVSNLKKIYTKIP